MNLDKLFGDKAVLVTGAGSGIGRVTARRLAERGARVAVASINEQQNVAAVDEIRSFGGEAISITADVSAASDVEHAVRRTVDAFGALHYAFNNAGIEGEFKPLTELSENVWDSVVDVNLKGIWLSMKYEIPAILASGGGAIVNTSTDLVPLGLPGTAIYTASKAGVDVLTRVGAIEYGRKGVRVNAVNPGNVKGTELTNRLWDEAAVRRFEEANPLGKIASCDDIAEAVLWLLSPKSGHVNGQTLNIDGGLTLI
jgi:NAD(P)-dependent dehydrogenase (short-subunit alcohol dehydrogenase family)